MKTYRYFLSVFFMVIVSPCLLVQTGSAATQPYISGHNINFATGNKYLSQTDYRIDTSGLTLSFTRTYNSQSTASSILGYGWIATGLEYLQVAADIITLVQPGGRHVDFLDNGQGQWINETDKLRVITVAGDGHLLTEHDGTTRTFNSNAKLILKTDKNSNTLTYTCTGADLTSISDDFGHTLSLVYTGGRLTTLTTPAGNFTYTYTNDNLTSVTKPDGTSRQYIYDDPNDPHNLTGIIDENSTRILTVAYDDQDQAISSAFADGVRQVSIDYQDNLQRVITNSLGVPTTYQLEAIHGIALITSFTGPGCSSCGEDTSSSYTYNDRLQALSNTNGRGIITNYEYDDRGNRTGKTEAVGTPQERATTWTYEADSSRIATVIKKSVVDPAQDTITAYAYDTNGNISTLISTGRVSGGSTESVTTTYTYDILGRIAAIDGPRTDVVDITTFTYYANEVSQGLNRGMLQKITNPLSHETLLADYNGFGQPQTITNPNGTITQNIYDLGGLLSSTTTAGITTSYEYYPNRQIYRITAPDLRIITCIYTPAGYPASITDSQGNTLSWFYNSEGKKTREEARDPGDSLTAFLRYAYEDSGRLDKVINPDDSFTGYDYDDTGNVISLVNAVNQTTSYDYDSLDRLSQMTRPAATITGYGYDSHDNITTVTDPENHATGYIHDDLGRRLSRNSPDTGNTQYSFDSAGNIVSAIDANNVETTSEYDALNRLTATHYPDPASDILYSYDQGTYGIGRLTGMTSTGAVYAYSYDATGNLLNENAQISGHSYLTAYTCNQSGQVTAITYPSGRTVEYTYDTLGHMTLVTSTFNESTTVIADNITYLPYGPLNHLEQGNTISYDAVFDQQYQMSGQTAGSVVDRTYTLNALGNVTAVTDNLGSGNNLSFAYDDLSRLASETGNYGSINYSHDKTGNRLSMTESGSTTTYSYETTSNRLTRVNNNSRSHDLAGMTTSSENGKYKYSYNNGNRLKSLTEKTGKMFFVIPVKDTCGQVTGTVVSFLSKSSKTQYLYDGLGRRTESVLGPDNGGRYHYHYDQNGTLLGFTFYDKNNDLLLSKEFIWLGDIPVAQADTTFTPSGAIESSSTIWLHTDHLNTPLLATNAAGNIVWRWNRNAFGTIEPDTNPDGDGNHFDIPLRFPGQVKMQGDGNLYYNMHRFYESGTGRYVTPDPIGLDGGINLFLYVGNDPVNFVDPWGLWCEIVQGEKYAGEEPIKEWEEVKKNGYWKAFGDYISWQLLFQIPKYPIPASGMKFDYIERHTIGQLFNEYIDYWEVCYDECGNEESREYVGKGKTGKTQKLLLDQWDVTKYIGGR